MSKNSKYYESNEFLDTPIHELNDPPEGEYKEALMAYTGGDLHITSDPWDIKHGSYWLYEESMSGECLYYHTHDPHKSPYVSEMTSCAEDLEYDVMDDIVSGDICVIDEWFAENLYWKTEEEACEACWEYLVDDSREQAEKNAKLNVKNIEVESEEVKNEDD